MTWMIRLGVESGFDGRQTWNGDEGSHSLLKRRLVLPCGAGTNSSFLQASNLHLMIDEHSPCVR